MSFIPGLRDLACDAYIKRVVALPGEIVSVNTKGELIINNKLIPEPYVSYKCSLSLFTKCGEFKNIKVPINMEEPGKVRKNRSLAGNYKNL